MPGRYFNWKLAIVLVIGLVVLVATAFGLRQWQRTTRAERGLLLGNKAYEEQRWEEAASQLGRYLSIRREDAPTLLKYAEANLNIRPLKRNRLMQALQAYRNVLRVEPNNSQAATQLTELYLVMGMAGEAELIAGRYLEANEHPMLRRMLATALVRQRKFAEANSALKDIIAKDPGQILAYDMLARLSETRPEDFPAEPRRLYDEAIAKNPSSALAYIVRAAFYLRRNDPNSLADLDQAEKLDLTDLQVRLSLAQALVDANSPGRAEKHLAAIEAADPTNQNLWQTRARLALVTRSKAKMVTAAENGLKALVSQPWDFMPSATELFIRGGRFDLAEDCLSRLYQKDISPEIVAFLRGMLEGEKGQVREALKYWQQAVELGYKSPRVRLSLASNFSLLGDRQAALRHLRTLVAEYPDSVDGHVALARELVLAGNWIEASKHAHRALQLSPTNSEAALLVLNAQVVRLAADPDAAQTRAWDDVEEQLSALEKASGGALHIRLLKFRALLERGKLAEAQSLLDLMKQDNQPDVRIALAEARLLYAQEKVDQTISLLARTMEEFPQEVEPAKLLALLLDEQGNTDESERVLKEAIARIERPASRRELALLLMQFYTLSWDRSERAYPLLSQLAEELPEDIPIMAGLLRCESVIKDPKKAQGLVDQIKLLEGENGRQWRYEQARLWYNSEDFKNRRSRCISLLQENLLANPDDLVSRMLLAATYEKGGQVQKALASYRETLNRAPQEVSIITLTVAALYRAGENDEAEQILSRASRENLNDPQLQLLQLQNYLLQDRLDLASNILQDFLVSDPNDSGSRLALARLRIRQENFAEAADLLDTLETQDPNSLGVMAARISLNIRQDKGEEAIKICDRIVSELGNASACILRAQAYNEIGQPDKATEDVERATAMEPNNVQVWLAQSRFYNSIGDPDKAEAGIERALALEPDNIQIQKLAFSMLSESGDSKKAARAKAILDKALASNPQDGELQLLKVRSLLDEQTPASIESARQTLERITTDQPKVSDAWALLGAMLLRQGQAAKALDTAMRGLVHKPDDRALLMLKGQAEAARSPILAIPTLKQLYDRDPKDVETGVLLADVYIRAGDPAKAVALLSQQLAVCAEPDRRRCKLALAIALHKEGKKADAQKELDSLRRSDPNDPGPLLTEVSLLRDDALWDVVAQKTSQWCQIHPEDTKTPVTIAAIIMEDTADEAKKTSEGILRMVLENDSGCVEAMKILGILLQTTGRVKEAAALYEKALTIQPDDVITINNLAWIVCEEQGKYKEALALSERALQIAPGYVDVIDTRGVVYYRLGELDKAIEDFNTCIKLYAMEAPGKAGSHFHLARALAAAGQKKEAREHLRNALDLQSQLEGETGGLSAKDVTEARLLLEELSREG
ncbi:MAG: tetratricopeptide repeat protein [Phycisphaerales bacterium]|nr:MAG: tetratricopeptide repeat protein [Phycisphaerales bacterium]